MFENLNDVFSSAAYKYLSAVDADPRTSNQHEIGGLVSAGIGRELGMPSDGSQISIPCSMVYLSDEEEEPIICEDVVTWYDARFTSPNRRPEWRLYYKSNQVSDRFRPGDFFLIARTIEGSLLLIFCPPETEYELQITALFGVRQTQGNRFTSVNLESPIAVPIRLIFARYGIDLGVNGQDYLDRILERFGERFPKTREFSEFCRSLSETVCSIENPDSALITWMETEESAFRQLERYIVRQKLINGFGDSGDDVDDFIRFSLSVQNRRKSRSGHAFENHIEEILRACGIEFERGAKTENRKKPDFLFPCSAAYSDTNYPSENLFLLGAKTTCKDRWRQVLAEANRITHKHLITLEPAISTSQTDEMRSQNLQLVVPQQLHNTYQEEQRQWLMSLGDFIRRVESVQRCN
ncbi:type II restriction endonuclease [Vibrio owensii]|uniref:type II restriction endonuclease n=1 Tax=Vibrio owensii TaxID=696485 RepID=UPI00339A2EC6